MRHAALLLLCVSTLASAAEMSHEETVVRTTYARLAYAVDLNTAYKAVRTNPKITTEEMSKQVAAHGLHFVISEVVVGDLKDIENKKYVEAAGQYPDGQDVIDSTVATENVTENGGNTVSTDTAMVRWGPGPNAIAPNVTVGQMRPILEQEAGISPILRYCSYTIKVSLDGRTREYKASFLFGADGQVAAGDTVVNINGGALSHFLTHTSYPDILMKTRYRESLAVGDFLSASKRAEASCNHAELCCDAESLQCGVPAGDLGREP